MNSDFRFLRVFPCVPWSFQKLNHGTHGAARTKPSLVFIRAFVAKFSESVTL